MEAGVEGQRPLAHRDPFQIALQRWKRAGPFLSTWGVGDSACEGTSGEIEQHIEESDDLDPLGCNTTRRRKQHRGSK